MTDAAASRTLPITDNPLYQMYFDFARKRELRIERCKSCATYIHLPQMACPDCSSEDLDWPLLSGKAVLDSYIITGYERDQNRESKGRTRNAIGGYGPFVVAQVCPVEAPSVRITSNVLNCSIEDVYVGMPLRVTFEVLSPEFTLAQFEPDQLDQTSDPRTSA